MPLETFRSLGWTEESLRRSRPGRPAPTRARARAGRPGVGPIVQVCTSTTFPVYALRLHGLCCDFLNADPPHALGKHARGHYKVDFVYSNSAFRARCMAHSVTVGAMCAMLRLAGEGRVAQKARPRGAPRPAIACSLYVSPAAICGDRVESRSRSLKALTRGRAGGAQLATGWGVWRQLGGKKHDYNLAFATGGIQALQAALGPKEAVDLKCVFRADLGDDWVRYLRTYGAGQRPRGPPSLSAASQKHCSYGPPPAGPDGGAGRGRSACGPSRAECARACRLQRAARPAGWRRCMRAALRRHPGSCFVKRLRLRWRPAAPDSRSASPRAQP